MPPAETSSLHYCGGTGQPTRRGPTRPESHAHVETVGQRGTDRYR
jgi:hypothetical protein